MKYFMVLLLIFCAFNSSAKAESIVQFEFPNEGWHTIQCPQSYNIYKTSECYAPAGQAEENFREMLVFFKFEPQKKTDSAFDALRMQLDKDLKAHGGTVPQFISYDENNSIAAICSRLTNTCIIERFFKSKENIYAAVYLNTMPHYSQNILGQWTNILSAVKAP